jgi:hypothetical protein
MLALFNLWLNRETVSVIRSRACSVCSPPSRHARLTSPAPHLNDVADLGRASPGRFSRSALLLVDPTSHGKQTSGTRTRTSLGDHNCARCTAVSTRP